MKVVDIKDKNALQNATEVLKKGGILVFPTDTVYGIGCLLDEKAIKRLYKIKNRPLNQPTAILATKKLFTDKILRDGKTTIVINKNKIDLNIPDILAKDNKIGIRVPNHKWLQKLIAKTGPIVASSSNKKSEPAPKKFSDISQEILEKADLVIESQEKMSGIPSKIINIEKNEILR